jgi:hypothetical protein
MQIELRKRTADAWLGHVVLITDAGQFTSTIPDDGEGVTIEGTTFTYSGTFEGSEGSAVEASVEVTCQ